MTDLLESHMAIVTTMTTQDHTMADQIIDLEEDTELLEVAQVLMGQEADHTSLE